MSTIQLSPTVQTAFAAFKADRTNLALPLILANDTLESLPPIYARAPESSFQNALNELDTVLNPRDPLYLILRRNDSLFAITFVPYLAEKSQRTFLLEYRHELVRQLGENSFSHLLICKEISEITDARSWDERNGHMQSLSSRADCEKGCEAACDEGGSKKRVVTDVGYKKTTCRLCDRRMKNKISPEALDALKTLETPGATIQIAVDISTDTLKSTLTMANIAPQDVSAILPTDKPSFTFYRHPATCLLYFIFHSPDCATVQDRMKHTMAIPGLINVHAEDQDVHVDQKIEIHEPDDLVFEAKDERIGKFRSMYLRNKFDGTESTYSSLETDKVFYDAVK